MCSSVHMNDFKILNWNIKEIVIQYARNMIWVTACKIRVVLIT